jgi:hypothetical protein
MTSQLDELRLKQLAAAFRMPSVQTMVSRKSSITNAFVNAIIPVVAPEPEEIAEALVVLGMEPADVRCAYCGDKASEWDHLRPIVSKQRPTGYISEIANLVPSCGKCNQSKGNSPWRTWIRSTTAKHSPTRRGIAETESRIQRLEQFDQWRSPTHVDFESLLGPDAWTNYWKLWKDLFDELHKCQAVAEKLRETIAAALNKG